ncbi:MAG: hypothetical protein EBR82_12390 [Caulobacteraceae bacterium]|nr:hypothetical protein [Caulobacteraceae bacterium]
MEVFREAVLIVVLFWLRTGVYILVHIMQQLEGVSILIIIILLLHMEVFREAALIVIRAC